MNGPITLPPHVAMRALAEELQQAATAYRVAWRAQQSAMDAWEKALEGMEEALNPEAARLLSLFNETADRALLLDIDVKDDALQHMEQGAFQLEAVAQAARALADALEAQARGLQ